MKQSTVPSSKSSHESSRSLISQKSVESMASSGDEHARRKVYEPKEGIFGAHISSRSRKLIEKQKSLQQLSKSTQPPKSKLSKEKSMKAPVASPPPSIPAKPAPENPPAIKKQSSKMLNSNPPSHQSMSPPQNNRNHKEYNEDRKPAVNTYNHQASHRPPPVDYHHFPKESSSHIPVVEKANESAESKLFSNLSHDQHQYEYQQSYLPKSVHHSDTIGSLKALTSNHTLVDTNENHKIQSFPEKENVIVHASPSLHLDNENVMVFTDHVNEDQYSDFNEPQERTSPTNEVDDSHEIAHALEESGVGEIPLGVESASNSNDNLPPPDLPSDFESNSILVVEENQLQNPDPLLNMNNTFSQSLQDDIAENSIYDGRKVSFCDMSDVYPDTSDISIVQNEQVNSSIQIETINSTAIEDASKLKQSSFCDMSDVYPDTSDISMVQNEQVCNSNLANDNSTIEDEDTSNLQQSSEETESPKKFQTRVPFSLQLEDIEEEDGDEFDPLSPQKKNAKVNTVLHRLLPSRSKFTRACELFDPQVLNVLVEHHRTFVDTSKVQETFSESNPMQAGEKIVKSRIRRRSTIDDFWLIKDSFKPKEQLQSPRSKLMATHSSIAKSISSLVVNPTSFDRARTPPPRLNPLLQKRKQMKQVE